METRPKDAPRRKGLTETELASHIHQLRDNGTSFYEISLTLPLDVKAIEELYHEYDGEVNESHE